EISAGVHLDGRVARRARRLLVGREQRVLERGDERTFLDALVALDLADRLDDLLAHLTPSRRSGSPARSTRTECPCARRLRPRARRRPAGRARPSVRSPAAAVSPSGMSSPSRVLHKKWARRAHFAEPVKMVRAV